MRQSIYPQDQSSYKNGGSSSNNSENFLSYGHHPRELASEGGGAGAIDSSKKFNIMRSSTDTEHTDWLPKDRCFDRANVDMKSNVNFKPTKVKEETWNNCTQTDQFMNCARDNNKPLLQKELFFGMTNQCVGTNNSASAFSSPLLQNEYKTKEAQVQSENSDTFKIPESGNFASQSSFTSNLSSPYLFNKGKCT